MIETRLDQGDARGARRYRNPAIRAKPPGDRRRPMAAAALNMTVEGGRMIVAPSHRGAWRAASEATTQAAR